MLADAFMEHSLKYDWARIFPKPFVVGTKEYYEYIKSTSSSNQLHIISH